MAGSGRPPPPITIVVPGRETPVEVLESGPRALSAPLPGRWRALLLAVVAVLASGVLVALDLPVQDPVRRAPVAVDDVPTPSGVSAQLGLVAEEPFTTVLDVAVTIPPGDPDRDDGAERAVQPSPQLKLMDIGGRGLAVRLVRRSPPLLLGYLGRFAGVAERVLHLPAEVVVADCRGGAAATPSILLFVQHTGGPLVTVQARGDASVERALAQLVRRTCRMSG